MSTERNGRPARAPASTRIVVPLFSQSMTSAGSVHASMPAPAHHYPLRTKLDVDAQRAERTCRRPYVGASGEMRNGAFAVGHCGEEQGPMRDRLVARDPQPAPQRAHAGHGQLVGHRRAHPSSVRVVR